MSVPPTGHPVDILKQWYAEAGVPLPPETEAQWRAFCDQLVECPDLAKLPTAER